MKVICGKANTGKTVQLLKAASEYEGCVVVCQNPERMHVKAYDNDIHNVSFVGYSDLDLINSGDTVLIDDVETFLSSIFEDCTVEGITVTCNDSSEKL